ncbi:MAG: VTT domain-containing protein [Candidatus Moduliflexus flocculans]|nr:VTT domain-containing protein [Candidatus Moduliflexus flocculans]
MRFIKFYLIFILILAGLLGFIFAGKANFSIESARLFIENLGILAPIAFILIYSIAPILFIPITPLAILGGMLFGVLWGTVFTVIGVSLGGVRRFFCSADIFLKILRINILMRKVKLIQEKAAKDGWKFVVIARITPIFPFNIQNYVFGVTNISLKSFFAATFFSMIPGSFVYVYMGNVGAKSLQGGAMNQFLGALFLMAMIICLPFLIKKIQEYAKRKRASS